jgi:hypothetical protein
MIKDMDKYNAAQSMGWSVFRVSSNHIEKGEVIPLLEKVLVQI